MNLEAIADETERKMAAKAEKAMKAVWPKRAGVDYERFDAVVSGIILSNPDLAECTMRSKLIAAHYCARIGLVPDPALGHIFILPYREKGVKVAKPILGYKGMIALAYRGRAVKSITAYPVFENDRFEYEEGLNPILRHVPWFKEGHTAPAENMTAYNRGVVAAYAIAELSEGGKVHKVISMREINKAASASPSARSDFSPWKGDSFPEMAMKTAVRRLGNLLPLSPEDPGLAIAIKMDAEVEEGRLEIPQEIMDAIGPEPAGEPDHSEALGKAQAESMAKAAGYSVADLREMSKTLLTLDYAVLTREQLNSVIAELDSVRVEVSHEVSTLAPGV